MGRANPHVDFREAFSNWRTNLATGGKSVSFQKLEIVRLLCWGKINGQNTSHIKSLPPPWRVTSKSYASSRAKRQQSKNLEIRVPDRSATVPDKSNYRLEDRSGSNPLHFIEFVPIHGTVSISPGQEIYSFSLVSWVQGLTMWTPAIGSGFMSRGQGSIPFEPRWTVWCHFLCSVSSLLVLSLSISRFLLFLAPFFLLFSFSLSRSTSHPVLFLSLILFLLLSLSLSRSVLICSSFSLSFLPLPLSASLCLSSSFFCLYNVTFLASLPPFYCPTVLSLSLSLSAPLSQSPSVSGSFCTDIITLVLNPRMYRRYIELSMVLKGPGRNDLLFVSFSPVLSHLTSALGLNVRVWQKTLNFKLFQRCRQKRFALYLSLSASLSLSSFSFALTSHLCPNQRMHRRCDVLPSVSGSLFLSFSLSLSPVLSRLTSALWLNAGLKTHVFSLSLSSLLSLSLSSKALYCPVFQKVSGGSDSSCFMGKTKWRQRLLFALPDTWWMSPLSRVLRNHSSVLHKT